MKNFLIWMVAVILSLSFLTRVNAEKKSEVIPVLTTSISAKLVDDNGKLLMYPTGTTTHPNYYVRIYTGSKEIIESTTGRIGTHPNKKFGHYYELPVKAVYGDNIKSNLVVYIQRSGSEHQYVTYVSVYDKSGKYLQHKRYIGDPIMFKVVRHIKLFDKLKFK